MYFTAAPDGRRWPLIERGLIDAPVLDVLDAYFDQAFEVGLERQGRHNSISFGHIIRQGRQDLVDKAVSTLLASAGGERLRWLLGDELALLVDNCALRFHEPGNVESHLQYHFDAEFIGTHHLAVNLWIPLDAVGRTSPGLTFLNPQADAWPLLKDWYHKISQEKDPSRPLTRTRYREKIIRDAVAGQVDETFYTPVLARGDALMFNQFILHATQQMDVPHEMRRSVEFRIAARDAIPTFYRNHGRPVRHWSWRDGVWTPVD